MDVTGACVREPLIADKGALVRAVVGQRSANAARRAQSEVRVLACVSVPNESYVQLVSNNTR